MPEIKTTTTTTHEYLRRLITYLTTDQHTHAALDHTVTMEDKKMYLITANTLNGLSSAIFDKDGTEAGVYWSWSKDTQCFTKEQVHTHTHTHPTHTQTSVTHVIFHL